MKDESCVEPGCPVHTRTDKWDLREDNSDFVAITYVEGYAVYTDIAPSHAMSNMLAYLTESLDKVAYETLIYDVRDGSIADGGYVSVATIIRRGAKRAHDFHVEAVDTLTLEGSQGLQTMKEKWS